MKRIAAALVLITGLSSCLKDRVPEPLSASDMIQIGDRQLVHYWHFNSGSLLQPAKTTGGATLEIGGAYDDVASVTPINAREGALPGNGLRVRNPSTTLLIKAPMTGYQKPLLSFAAMRTDNGPKENIISYTLDGITYLTEGISRNVVTITPEWSLYSVDFAAIEGTTDNPDFAIKITFNIGHTNASGNDRYDNIAIDALPYNNGSDPGTPEGDSLLHYWNFNSAATDMAVFTLPAQSIGGALLDYAGNYMDPVNEGSTLNARQGDPAGNALRLRNPAGTFTLSLPSTGFKNIRLAYAVNRTSQGAQSNHITYTTDGVNYTGAGLSPTDNLVSESFTRIVYDFSSLEAVNDNPHFKVRIDFGTGADNASGNNRFDNITLEGTPL